MTIYIMRGIQFRKVNQFWNGPLSDVRGGYDFVGLAFIFLTLIYLIGLLRKKKWGRELAIAWNMTAFMIALGGRIFIYLFSTIYLGYPASAAFVL